MKLKKIISLALCGVMAFSTAFYTPVNANEVSKSYFENVSKVSTWDKAKSLSNLSLGVKADSDATINYKVDIDIDSAYDTTAQTGEAKITVKGELAQLLQIPNFVLKYDSKNVYLDKDGFNYLAGMAGIEKQATKSFVKIPFDDKTIKELGFTATPYAAMSSPEYSKQVTQKMLDFIQKIDLGIDLGLKQNGNTYTLSWDGDKMVDVTNAYFKYLFDHPETLFDMYKEVLGIDLEQMYKEMGMEITRQDFIDGLKEAKVEWANTVEPMLKQVKTIIKGSKLTMTETFEEAKYNQNITLNLVVDIAKGNELFDGVKYEKPELFKIDFSTKSDSQKSDDLKIAIPTDVEEFNVVKYVEEQSKKALEEYETPPNVEEKATFDLEIRIQPSTKQLKIVENGTTVVDEKVDAKMVNGALYVSKEAMEDIILLEEVESKEAYVPFKTTMQEHGYSVSWDSETKSTVATSK